MRFMSSPRWGERPHGESACGEWGRRVDLRWTSGGLTPWASTAHGGIVPIRDKGDRFRIPKDRSNRVTSVKPPTPHAPRARQRPAQQPARAELLSASTRCGRGACEGGKEAQDGAAAITSAGGGGSRANWRHPRLPPVQLPALSARLPAPATRPHPALGHRAGRCGSNGRALTNEARPPLRGPGFVTVHNRQVLAACGTYRQKFAEVCRTDFPLVSHSITANWPRIAHR